MAHKDLASAKVNNKDEFYTLMPTIESELEHYTEHFKGKVVLCNCDDPLQSNFVKYFMLKFHSLGLKRLVSTCYKSQDMNLFSQGDSVKAVYMTYEGEMDGNLPDYKAMKIHHLEGDGDFRSEECRNLLNISDIVTTNPPFSLFVPYIRQLIESGKKFLILGRQSALHYADVFPLIKDNLLWPGYNFNSSVIFKSAYENTDEKNRRYVRSKGYDPDDKYIKVPAITWFTNLEQERRHQDFVPYKKYKAEEYPRYLNYDAIDVSKVALIPGDYDGPMGVPDTFLGQYNPGQYEILGNGCIPDSAVEMGVGIIGKEWMSKYRTNGGRGHYSANMHTLVLYDNKGVPVAPYSRIIIRKRNTE